MKILFALEMVGTVNALEGAFRLLREKGAELRFAAHGVALTALSKKGVSCATIADAADAVIAEWNPDFVVVGLASGAAFSGFELGYGRAAMDRGIPVVAYRDYLGVAEWTRQLASHPRSRELLRFFLFDAATEQTVSHTLPCREARVVGSGYYDEDATRDWGQVRRDARRAAGITDGEFVVFLNNSADRVRVLEVIE